MARVPQVCIICKSPKRNIFNIFTCEESPWLDKRLSKVLGLNLSLYKRHNLYICDDCLTTFEKIEILEIMKGEFISKFRRKIRAPEPENYQVGLPVPACDVQTYENVLQGKQELPQSSNVDPLHSPILNSALTRTQGNARTGENDSVRSTTTCVTTVGNSTDVMSTTNGAKRLLNERLSLPQSRQCNLAGLRGRKAGRIPNCRKKISKRPYFLRSRSKDSIGLCDSVEVGEPQVDKASHLSLCRNRLTELLEAQLNDPSATTDANIVDLSDTDEEKNQSNSNETNNIQHNNIKDCVVQLGPRVQVSDNVYRFPSSDDEDDKPLSDSLNTLRTMRRKRLASEKSLTNAIESETNPAKILTPTCAAAMNEDKDALPVKETENEMNAIPNLAEAQNDETNSNIMIENVEGATSNYHCQSVGGLKLRIMKNSSSDLADGLNGDVLQTTENIAYLDGETHSKIADGCFPDEQCSSNVSMKVISAVDNEIAIENTLRLSPAFNCKFASPEMEPYIGDINPETDRLHDHVENSKFLLAKGNERTNMHSIDNKPAILSSQSHSPSASLSSSSEICQFSQMSEEFATCHQANEPVAFGSVETATLTTTLASSSLNATKDRWCELTKNVFDIDCPNFGVNYSPGFAVGMSKVSMDPDTKTSIEDLLVDGSLPNDSFSDTRNTDDLGQVFDETVADITNSKINKHALDHQGNKSTAGMLAQSDARMDKRKHEPMEGHNSRKRPHAMDQSADDVGRCSSPLLPFVYKQQKILENVLSSMSQSVDSETSKQNLIDLQRDHAKFVTHGQPLVVYNSEMLAMANSSKAIPHTDVCNRQEKDIDVINEASHTNKLLLPHEIKVEFSSDSEDMLEPSMLNGATEILNNAVILEDSDNRLQTLKVNQKGATMIYYKQTNSKEGCGSKNSNDFVQEPIGVVLFDEGLCRDQFEGMLLCGSCTHPVMFTEFASYEMHLSICHQRSLLYKCTKCGARSKSAFSAESHLIQMHCMKMNMNKFNNSSGSDKITMDDGSSKHSIICDPKIDVKKSPSEKRSGSDDENCGNEFRCEICDITFTSHEDYVDHMDIHSNPMASDRFLCGICNVTFSSHKECFDHMDIHAELTPNYKCQKCPSYFDTSELLKLHENGVH